MCTRKVVFFGPSFSRSPRHKRAFGSSDFRNQPPGAMRHPDSEPLQPCVTVGESPPRCNWIAWRSAAARPPRMWGEENVKMMDMRARLLGWVSLGLSAVPTSPPSAHQGSPAPYSQPISPRSLTKMKISGGDRARRERPNPSAQATPTYTPTHTHTLTHTPLASFPRVLLWLPPSPTHTPSTPTNPHFLLGLCRLLPGCVWWVSSKLLDWLRAGYWLGRSPTC